MSLRIAIMQPTYLPWVGYFDLMDRVDAFVLLDNVQFEKQSWQQRNRIRTAKELEWLSLPILNSGHSGQLIVETRTSGLQFVAKHLKTIAMNYGRSAFFKDEFPVFEQRFKGAAASGGLADLNIGLIRWLAERLGIATPLHISSQMPCNGKRSELLVDICRHLGAGEYLSPVGSAEYLREDRHLFDTATIQVRLHGYEHPVYRQVYPPFMPFATALDLLFNEGPRALEILRSGRRDSILL